METPKHYDILSDGQNKGKLAFYCRLLHVSRQEFHDYLKRLNRPWKYERIVEEMRAILAEEKEDDTYGRKRMYDALQL